MKLTNIKAFYEEKIIFEDMNVEFDQVGMTFIKGDSGVGKTTLLNILYGLKPFEGEYIVDGEKNEFIRNNMAYIFQDFKVDSNLTVYENIVLQYKIKGIQIDNGQIAGLLARFDMSHNKGKLTKVLSGGEKQRLAIIRGLVTNPSVLLCDEPTGNIDEDKSFEIFDMLYEISQDRLVIVVSHNEALIEKYSDVTYEVQNQALVCIKEKKLNKLIPNNLKTKSISRKDLVEKSINNLKTDLIKKLANFLAFSLLASIFLILNFSSRSIDDYFIEKYNDYGNTESIYLKLKQPYSIEELNTLSTELEFDSYLIDRSASHAFSKENPYLKRKDFISTGRIAIYPDFFEGEVLEKSIEETKQHEDYSALKRSLMYNDYNTIDNTTIMGSVMAVSEFDDLESYLIAGRLPENEYELLINEALVKELITLHNKLISKNDLDKPLIGYDSLNYEGLSVFIDKNRLSLVDLMYSNYFVRKSYNPEVIYNLDFSVVGVIDDYKFGFDYGVHVDYLIRGRSDFIPSSATYISTKMFLDYSKLASEYYIEKNMKDNFADLQAVLNDNSVNLNEMKLFGSVVLHKKGMSIVEYLDYITVLENHSAVREVLYSQVYIDYKLDLVQQKRIDLQINIYSVLILTLGFLSAFIPFYLMFKNRREEFFMYRILGMEKSNRFRLFIYELSFLFIVISVMIGLLGILLTTILEEQLCNILGTLIYSSDMEELIMKFDFKFALILIGLYLPFIVGFKVVETREISND